MYHNHKRDENILFIEEGHKYIIHDKLKPSSLYKYTSVTTWIHKLFEKFDADLIIEKMMKGKGWKGGHKYWGLSPYEIKEIWSKNSTSVSGEGTLLHYEIECFMNNNNIKCGGDYGGCYTHQTLIDYYLSNNKETKIKKEWEYFIQFVKDYSQLKPYRTEWIVYHEDLQLAGSIDMVYENDDGTLSIYDWKRSKNITRINNFNKFSILPQICHLPDSNFWHYTLQLNMYKKILEDKYSKIVKDLFLVQIHPINKSYEIIPLPILTGEINDICIEIRRTL